MLKFKEYLKEESDDVISVDKRNLEQNVDAINSELDTITANPYQNASIVLKELRRCLERFGIVFPREIEKNFLDLSSEIVYSLGTSSFYLYIIFDTNEDSFVDSYAQIVSEEELQDLVDMDKEDLLDREPIQQKQFIPPARRDDDSGNGTAAEYADSAYST